MPQKPTPETLAEELAEKVAKVIVRRAIQINECRPEDVAAIIKLELSLVERLKNEKRYRSLIYCTAGEWDNYNSIRIDEGIPALEKALDSAIQKEQS